MAKFIVYSRPQGDSLIIKWTWLLADKDDKPILMNKQGFDSEDEARDNIKLIKKSITKFTKVEKS